MAFRYTAWSDTPSPMTRSPKLFSCVRAFNLTAATEMLFIHRSLSEHYRQLAKIYGPRNDQGQTLQAKATTAEHLRLADGTRSVSQATDN